MAKGATRERLKREKEMMSAEASFRLFSHLQGSIMLQTRRSSIIPASGVVLNFSISKLI